MSDLTKLTAEELRNQKILTLEMWEEAFRRLERLEQCESQVRDYEAELERHATDRVNQRKRLEQCEAALKDVCSSVTDDNFWNVVDDVPLRNAVYSLYEILEWPKPEIRKAQ